MKLTSEKITKRLLGPKNVNSLIVCTIVLSVALAWLFPSILEPIYDDSQHSIELLGQRFLGQPQTQLFYIRAAFASGFTAFVTYRGQPLVFSFAGGRLIPHNGRAYGLLSKRGWTIEEDGIIRYMADGYEAGLYITKTGFVRKFAPGTPVPSDSNDVIWLHMSRIR